MLPASSSSCSRRRRGEEEEDDDDEEYMKGKSGRMRERTNECAREKERVAACVCAGKQKQKI